MTVSLKCTSGSLAGRTIKLEGGPVFIFGRYGKAHISLASDPSASQLHFLIDTSEDRVRIIDIGSTNGLVVNDTLYGGKFGKPPKDFIILADGDNIIAGGNHFQVSIKKNTDSHPKREGMANAGTQVISDAAPDNSPSQSRSAGATVDNGAFPDIEGYTILEKIGSGGRGAVYKAIRNQTGEKTAIKIMLGRTLRKRRALDSFRREIQITRQLSHPHIIRYIDDGIAGDSPYLALEYVSGGNLDQLIRNSPEKRLPFTQAVPLFIQVLEAVGYMHDKSLVHKDIKPKNILLDPRMGGAMSAKLSDMGLSSRVANSDENFLPAVNEGGTPAYMPPEQLTDITKSLPQSDVFSAAATVYQMLSGKLLYDFKDKDQVTTILDGNIVPILTLCPELPGRFAEVINKALSYYPEHRYADANEMLAALKNALD